MPRPARSKAASPVKKWGPASEAWVRAFSKAVEKIPAAQKRKMFGYAAAFANGNMFAGLHQAGLVLRLPEAEREALLKLPGASAFEPMPGRVMREYVVAPEALAAHPREVEAWLSKAFAHASRLPPKRGAGGKSRSRAK